MGKCHPEVKQKLDGLEYALSDSLQDRFFSIVIQKCYQVFNIHFFFPNFVYLKAKHKYKNASRSD